MCAMPIPYAVAENIVIKPVAQSAPHVWDMNFLLITLTSLRG